MSIKSSIASHMSKERIAGAIKGWAGEAPIDLAIRQAIRLCCMMLPKDKRTVEHVTEIMDHLMQRGLDDLHKNAAAYGLKESPQPHEGDAGASEDHRELPLPARHDDHPHEGDAAAPAHEGEHGHEGQHEADVQVAEVVAAPDSGQPLWQPSELAAAPPSHEPVHPAPSHAAPPHPAQSHPVAPHPAAPHPAAPHAPAPAKPVWGAPGAAPGRSPAGSPPVRGPQPAQNRPRLPGDRPPRKF